MQEDKEEDKWGEGSQEKTLQFLPRTITNRRLKVSPIFQKLIDHYTDLLATRTKFECLLQYMSSGDFGHVMLSGTQSKGQK